MSISPAQTLTATAPYPVGSRTPTDVAQRVLNAQPPNDPDFVAFINEVAKRYGNEQLDYEWRKHQKSLVNEKFYRGEQHGRVSRLDGKWETKPKKKGAPPRHVHNWIRGFSDAITSQWVLANTELQVVPIPDGNETDEARGAADIGEDILDHYQRKILTEEFKQSECKTGQFTGDMFRYTIWDAKAGEQKVKRPKFEETEQSVGGAYQCLDCEYGGSLDDLQQGDETTSGYGNGSVDTGNNGANVTSNTGDGVAGIAVQNDTLQACPQCGSPNLQIEQGESVSIPTVVGYDETPLGDIVCHQVLATQIKYDRTVPKFEQSVFLRWRMKMRVEVVKELIPDWSKDASGSYDGNSDDPSLRVQRSLNNTVGNISATQPWASTGASGGKDEPETVIVDRWWFKPCVYARYRFKQDVVTVGGETIPAGTEARAAFPNGLYVMLVSGEMLDFRDEDFTKFWQHTPMNLIPNQVSGDSLMEDLIEPQKRVNLTKDLKLSNIINVDGAGIIYNQNVISGDSIPSTPYSQSPAKNVAPDFDLRKAVVAVPRTPLPSEVFQDEAEQREEMQWMTKTYPTSVGAPDVKGGGTATEADLTYRGAQAQRSPELALRAQGDAEWGMQVLQLFQENASDEMYFPFLGKNGQQNGRYYKGSDLPKTFVVTHRPRSYIPKNETDRRNDLMAALNLLGGIEGVMMTAQAMPKLLDEVNDRFDVNLDFTDSSSMARIGRDAIDAMKAQAQAATASAGALGDPSLAAEILTMLPECQVDPDTDLDGLMAFLRKWKMQDEGVKARRENQVLYAGVTKLIENCKLALVQAAQEESAMQIAAQAPAMAVAQGQQQQAIGQEQAREDEQGDKEYQRQQEGKSQDMAAGQAQAQKQGQQQQAEAEAGRRHEMAKMQMQQAGAEKLARMNNAQAAHRG